MSLVFFKVSKEKELERVQTSKKSLHYRRSLIIQDRNSLKLWLINGSKVSQDIRKKGLSQAKELNAKNGFIYQIKDIDSSQNEGKVGIILEQKSMKKERKPKKAKSKMKKPLTISNENLVKSNSSHLKFRKPHYPIIDSRENITHVKAGVQSETILESFVTIVQILNKAVRRENSQKYILRQLNDEIERFLQKIYEN